MKTKTLMNPAEEDAALLENALQWNACNPNHAISLGDWGARLVEAKAQGYVSEGCSCGAKFLAFHHYTTCCESDCPFSDGVSLLDRLAEKVDG